MAITYLSEEWIIETGKLLADAFQTPSRVTTALVEIYQNCPPDGKTKWIEMQMEKGVMTVYNHGEGEAPPAKYRIVGDYSEYVKVSNGSMDPEAGLMNGAFEFEGNLVTGLTLIGIYKKILETRRALETDFNG